MNENTREKIERSIAFHEEMKPCSFRKPSSGAASRGVYKKNKNFRYSFVHEGQKWDVSHSAFRALKNIYYNLWITCEGERKTIRDLKRLVKGG